MLCHVKLGGLVKSNLILVSLYPYFVFIIQLLLTPVLYSSHNWLIENWNQVTINHLFWCIEYQGMVVRVNCRCVEGTKIRTHPANFPTSPICLGLTSFWGQLILLCGVHG